MFGLKNWQSKEFYIAAILYTLDVMHVIENRMTFPPTTQNLDWESISALHPKVAVYSWNFTVADFFLWHISLQRRFEWRHLGVKFTSLSLSVSPFKRLTDNWKTSAYRLFTASQCCLKDRSSTRKSRVFNHKRKRLEKTRCRNYQKMKKMQR